MAKMIKTTLTLPDDLRTEARVKALREGRTLSDVVREYLEQYIKGDAPKAKEPTT